MRSESFSNEASVRMLVPLAVSKLVKKISPARAKTPTVSTRTGRNPPRVEVSPFPVAGSEPVPEKSPDPASGEVPEPALGESAELLNVPLSP